MHSRPLVAAAIVACSWVTGCRSINPSIELLESELRHVEDQLYWLDRELSLRDQQLASCRKHNEALRRELESQAAESGRAASVPDQADGEGAESLHPPSITLTPDDLGDGELLQPPVTEQGPPEPAEPEPPAEPAPLIPPSTPATPPATGPSEESGGSAATGTDNRTPNLHVHRIRIHPRLTGGYDTDHLPGDDGVLVVVEPQDAAGEYLPAPAPLSVVLLDPTRSGPAARIARWDFNPAESVALLRKSLLGKGFHLRLPWPDRPPRTPNLQLVVRYTTADGRQLLDRRTIRIDVPAAGPVAHGPGTTTSVPPSESAAPRRSARHADTWQWSPFR